MSRYNTNGGGDGSNGGNNDYDDDITLKLKEYAAVRFIPTYLNSHTHSDYGTSFIQNYEDAEVLDGIVFQRDDKPQTWNVYSADKFFHLNEEDGLVYENYDDEADEYSEEMSAQDILEHPRVVGHSTSGGQDDYYFTPVGVVIEEAGDIAVADDMDVGVSDEPAIQVGNASMLLGNNSWTRTYAKKLTEAGNAIVEDNGDDPTPRGEEETNPKYKSHYWMTEEDPTLRDDLDGRAIELWITRETINIGDGETTSYRTPNVEDVKTENQVTIDNGVDGDSEADTEKAAATDGGTAAQDAAESDTESPETTDSPGDGGLPDGVPDSLDDLLDYVARNDKTDAESIRDFAADEVDSPDDVDWDAAAEVAQERAE